MREFLKDIQDTEIQNLPTILFEDDPNDEIEEDLYQYSKTIQIKNELEVELFIDSQRKKKKWNTFYKLVFTNLEIIKERHDNKSLHTNQVLLTDEYDD